MITYLLPMLIGYTGGKIVYDTRGGVVGRHGHDRRHRPGPTCPDVPRRDDHGPARRLGMKRIDALWDGKIKPGFEMLVNNFSAGIWGGILAIVGFFALSPVLTWVTERPATAWTSWSRTTSCPSPRSSIEPAKVLFLNNAINHGVLTPLGAPEAAEKGKSVLFLLEANPAPGLGLLMAYTFFGKGLAKASAPGAAIIQFFGGIHEVYFPFVLMKPKMIVAMIAGGMTGILINDALRQSGLRSPAAPGSIFAVYLRGPGDVTNLVGITSSSSVAPR